MVIKDALKPLREPVAWILLAAVVLFFGSALIDLFDKPDALTAEKNWFLYNAYFSIGSFANVTIPVVLLAAMLTVTVLPDRTKLAKPIVLAAMIEAGVMLLFGIMTLVLGLFYKGSSSKFEHILFYLPMLALTVIPLLVGLAMIRTAEMSPPRPQQPMGVPPQGGYYHQPQVAQQPPYPGAPYGGWQGGTPQQPQPPQQQPPHTYGQQGWS
ncbi:MAG TPA: hypothetical protein VF053_07445 [Streptosporangiales bacterium]